MKKNHSSKSRSKKANNYKCAKECKNMKKNDRATEFIMANQQAAHKNITVIAERMFEMAELNTDYINQEFYRSFIESFFKYFNDEPQLFCDTVLVSDNCFDALDIVLTADKEFAEEYNGLSYEEQFPLFLQLISLLTCCNYTDRAKMLYSLLAVTAQANATNDEGIVV